MISSKQFSQSVRTLSVQHAIATFLTAASAIFIGSAVAQSIPCTQESPIGYVGKRIEGAKAVIVFVHGVLSDSRSAWTYPGRWWWSNAVYWPCLMREDTAFSDVNIYVHQYQANLGASPTIEKVAGLLRQDLGSDDVLSHPNIAFVTHSMGGLVTAGMLIHSSSSTFLTNVKLVKFFGTPGSGPGFNGVTRWLSDKAKEKLTNEQFKQLMNVKLLEDLRSSWSSRKWPFRTFCSSESAETWPLGIVVSHESAASMCNGDADPLYGLDHSAIVKPADRGVESYRRVHRRFSQCVKPYIRQSKAAQVSQSDGGIRSLRWLSEFQNAQMKLKEGIDLADVKANIDPLLYYSGILGSNLYLSPKDPQPGFSGREYESASSNVFLPVLMERLGTGQQSVAKHAWINRVNSLDDHVREPTFIAMRDDLIARGGISPDDYAIGLENKASGAARRVVLVVGVLDRPGQQPLVGLKGFLDLPPANDPCEDATAKL